MKKKILAVLALQLAQKSKWTITTCRDKILWEDGSRKHENRAIILQYQYNEQQMVHIFIHVLYFEKAYIIYL